MISITPIKAFNDNYIWAIHDTCELIVVDPGDASPVLEFIDENNLNLTTIIVTHWHPDHIGGIKELVKKFSAKVIGPKSEKIPQVTDTVAENTSISLLKEDFQVLSIPGHTLEHIAFYSSSLQALFCGDTLFAGGCGRIFEGTPEQMLKSLNKLMNLPKDTKIYCAHEYTLANLQFALEVEPNNTTLQERLLSIADLRAKELCTLPSTLAIELETNPFLRSTSEHVVESALNQGAVSTSELDVFTCIREWKNNF